ncbi:MAG: N-acetyl-gamma-glutamyl-phosphate reductase [Bacillota bacterium]|jgi:N-acetyl-gamma-glutamyl-phosphate reductase
MTKLQINASIVGVTGYTGGELLRLLLGHLAVNIKHITAAKSFIGEQVTASYSYLEGLCAHKIEKTDIEKVVEDSDLIFLAMPAGQGIEPAAAAVAKGKKIIDISTDFRFRDTAVYEEWYGVKHNYPQLAEKAVYGLPELYRNKIAGADIIANPGCFPTASLLALYPLFSHGLVKRNSVIIDAKSGVSGAGRSPTANNIYAQVNENIKAYNVGRHRHTPEIEQILTDISAEEQVINFTPHLTPMTRGILSTVYVDLKDSSSAEDLTKLYRETYADEYFVKVHDVGNWPQSKWAWGSNFCHIGVTYDPRTQRAIACGAIDNLMKGAAGQAVQNMNILFGLPENQGLEAIPIFP